MAGAPLGAGQSAQNRTINKDNKTAIYFFILGFYKFRLYKFKVRLIKPFN